MASGETKRRDEADVGKTGSDVEVLRSGREEARLVLDHQLQVLNDLQEKAIRTVKIAGVILGLVLSAGTLPGAERFVNEFTFAGIGSWR
jgi:hypothetical protein